jgi:hypothetical protein
MGRNTLLGMGTFEVSLSQNEIGDSFPGYKK